MVSLLRSVAALVLLATLIALVGPAELARVLSGLALAPFLLALATYGGIVALRTWRWQGLLRRQAIPVPAPEALQAYSLGMLLGAVTPARVGQHAKAALVRRLGQPWDRALTGSLVDQGLDALASLSVLAVAAVYLGLRLRPPFAVLGIVAGALLLLGALLGPRLWRRAQASLAEAVTLVRQSLGLPLLLSFAALGLYLVTLALVGRAVHVGVADTTLVLASAASAIVEIAPVTVAGIGTREAALLALLRPFGAELGRIVAFTMLVRALHIGVAALGYLGATLVVSRRTLGRASS